MRRSYWALNAFLCGWEAMQQRPDFSNLCCISLHFAARVWCALPGIAKKTQGFGGDGAAGWNWLGMLHVLHSASWVRFVIRRPGDGLGRSSGVSQYGWLIVKDRGGVRQNTVWRVPNLSTRTEDSMPAN